MFAKTFIAKLALAGATAAAVAATALPAAASIDGSIYGDQQLINRATAEGRIGFYERARLENRLHEIVGQRDFEWRRNGGFLYPGQRYQLQVELNQERDATFWAAHGNI